MASGARSAGPAQTAVCRIQRKCNLACGAHLPRIAVRGVAVIAPAWCKMGLVDPGGSR
ncbi:hypothetical protein SLG_33450 [Sphingobium sp. SYK-6]|nr:hypothetical protein SLG_33450 [Sphingobium sp. SYK-6]